MPAAFWRSDSRAAQAKQFCFAISAIISAGMLRFCYIDPAIYVVAATSGPEDELAASNYRESQFEAYEIVVGKTSPELGGSIELVDAIGLNYYVRNQWVLQGPTLSRDDLRYRPLREMLSENYSRNGKPLFIAETVWKMKLGQAGLVISAMKQRPRAQLACR